jgi:hypothetical protein
VSSATVVLMRRYAHPFRAIQTFSSNPPLLNGVGQGCCLIRTDYLLDDVLDDDKLKTYQSLEQI